MGLRFNLIIAVVAALTAAYWELQDPRNHYEALSLRRSASKAEVRAAYKKKALLYHPDKALQSRNAAWQLWRAMTKGEARCARRFLLISEAVEVSSSVGA